MAGHAMSSFEARKSAHLRMTTSLLSPQAALASSATGASGFSSSSAMVAIAATGVDRISVGGLTHSAVSLDVALDVEG